MSVFVFNSRKCAVSPLPDSSVRVTFVWRVYVVVVGARNSKLSLPTAPRPRRSPRKIVTEPHERLGH